MPEYPLADVVFEHATVYDGLASPPRYCRVGIAGDRLIVPDDDDAPLPVAEHTATVDASGLVLAPGFIDIHTHSDFSCLIDRDAASRLAAGVTTEIVGNCGFGAFPLAGEIRNRRRAEFAPRGLVVDWDDAESYFSRLESTPTGVNVGVLVGHGNLHAVTAGYNDKPMTDDQRRIAADILHDAMRQGAFGMSIGLIYSPGMFADHDELVAMAEVVARHDGLYAAHLRSEGKRLTEAIDEFLSSAGDTGARAQISHLKIMHRGNWHKLPALREQLFRLRDEGVDFMADRYPYQASCTDLSDMLLPAWALAGTADDIADRCRGGSDREELRYHLQDRQANDAIADNVMITSVPDQSHADLVGRTLLEIAEHADGEPVEVVLDLLARCPLGIEAVSFSMNEDNCREILSWDFVMVASDSSRHQLGHDPLRQGHPRAFGTPARFLGQFVRQSASVDWPTAIHKLTGMPADRVHLSDRGRIVNNAHADLVLFDPATIADRSEYHDSGHAPAGIRRVYVNGRLAWHDGQPSDVAAGRLLRHNA